MKRSHLLPLVATAAAGAALAPGALGAGGPDAHAAKASVAVAAKEFKFTLRPATVPSGPVTFHVTNVGKIKHNFKIAGKKTRDLDPKKAAALTVNLKKGTFPYVCTIPGHAAAGMKGTLRVG